MKTTVEYLDALRDKLRLPSDYAAAKVLGVTPSTVSKYRLGRSVFDERIAIHVAEILDLDPLEVIAACKAESAPDSHVRSVWEKAWGKAVGATAAATLAVCAVGLVAAPSPADAVTIHSNGASLYLMSNCTDDGPVVRRQPEQWDIA